MANSASHAALPYPIKNARYTVLVPFLDSTGTPTDPTTPDTEFSGDAGAFADCAEEVTTISGSNGMGYITLTGAETNFSMLAVAFKAASGPKTTLMTLSPAVLAVVGTGTLSAGSAGGGTLGTILAYDVTGCFVMTTGGTGGGGTGGANNQARKIVTYTTSTGAFTVTPNWETTPSTDTTYSILLPEGVSLGMLKALNPATPGRTVVVDSNGLADSTAVKVGPSGTGTAQTARDLGLALPAVAPNTNGGLPILSSSGTTLAYTISTLTTYTGNTPQTGDSFARLGVAGAGLTALGDARIANLDALVSSRMATYTQPAGFLAATFPLLVASTTNITAGTITTATNVTMVNGLAAGVITAASIAADAITAAKIADGAIDTATFAAGTTIPRVTLADILTTYTGNTPQTGDAFARIGANGISLSAIPDEAGITTLLARLTSTRSGYLDNLSAGPVVLAGSAPSWYTAPVDVSANVTAIKAKTDQLTFTVANQLRADVRYVNGTQVQGAGTAGNPWRPV